MKIELRNVKHAKFASEETPCFKATIYIDGKRAGTASNDGRGGCTWIEPRELQHRLDEYAKTLPEYADAGFDCGEFVVTDAFADWEALQDMRRVMKHRVLFAMPDGTFRETTRLPPERLRQMLESPTNLERCCPGGVSLNSLPEAEALALYKKGSTP